MHGLIRDIFLIAVSPTAVYTVVLSIVICERNRDPDILCVKICAIRGYALYTIHFGTKIGTFVKMRILLMTCFLVLNTDTRLICPTCVHNSINQGKILYLVLFFSAIFLMHFLPWTQELMTRGWEIIGQANDYFWIILLTIVGGSFGVTTLNKFKK